MRMLKLTEHNIEDQHLCCAISDKKCRDGYAKKQTWLKSEFKNGYTFQKFDVRGKVFIEYVPIEHSWLPLQGSNFMVINCFWVSGKFKGEGNGKKLLQQCMKDAGNMDGVVAISSDKKRPFMSDPDFLKHQGFEIIDEAPPFSKLWGLKTNPESRYPTIMKSAKSGVCPDNNGITAYYSNSCPFTDYYTNQLLRDYAENNDIPLTIHHIKSKKDGRKMPIPWIINSVFYKGQLVTLEMKAERHLDKLIHPDPQ
ncbi:YoaP domain-containing protein [Aestuariirhabdus sp. Z084]|uniref:YoaP domain-containing protein n=1 Tax=Aestuariirhabdus haliotis TaxID=2918751 RepID=UPI00201B38D9|nr:YoaP domain-containing protein [Aestuariirhabdus haliotis]MCL6415695.1 YoaP domain-containing protein [Aestuariirhabdus haliotis]MCL6419779.1 YoaP domain-containing protein [Aestuariirhabdus haliotis]